MFNLRHRTSATLTSVALLMSIAPQTHALETAGKTNSFQTAPATARGVLVARQSANIAAGMTGKLSAVPYKTGQYVKRGATIAEFNCDRQEADLKSRKAALATQVLKYENQTELHSMGAAGALDVSIAKSERDQIAADVSAIEIAMKDCVVYAPFSGFVTARHIHAFESAQAGQPLYSLNRAGKTDVSIIAPSVWASWVTPGKEFTFDVDETGESVKASVQRLSAVVDPVSQTIEITATLVGKHKSRPGMSGRAVFSSHHEDKSP